MDTDFPVIEDPVAAAPAPAHAVATQQPGGELSIETFNLKTLALAYFGPWRANVTETKLKLTGVEHDMTTPTKIADVKSLRHRLINVPLATARATSEALKKKLNGTKTDVVNELEAIEAGYAEAAKLITPQIEAAEAKLAEEKRIAAEKEAARVQGHRDALDRLAAPAERAASPDMTAERIAKGIELVEAIVIDRAAWEDFADRAEEQKAVTLERMRALHAKAVAAEAEAARLAEERAEAARVAEAQRIEAARLAAIAADLARQHAELQAERDRIAAEAKARADEAARVEQETADRELRESLNRSAEAARAREAAEALAIQPAEQDTPAQGSQQVLKAEAPAPDATDRDAPASTSPSVGSMGARQAADAAPSVEAEVPTLTLGTIKERIAPLSITAEGLASLGYHATKIKATCFYSESDWNDIKAAMRKVLA
ncbi:MAG: hypothetical protein EOP35_01660 [Rubrivivax sp.]|nr:MAG: hypothetical protein EOP35_01660 [Rubrivivax sp.]